MVMAQPVLQDVVPADASDVIDGDVWPGQRQDLLEIRCVGHAAAAGLPGAARPSFTRKAARGSTILDLLVAADGRVEHVRLRTPPRDVHEFMLVSAAKAWRFEPATVQGRPVRFRLSVAITSLTKGTTQLHLGPIPFSIRASSR